jgi:hypothetical protein
MIAILMCILVVVLASCGARSKPASAGAASTGEAYALYQSAVEALDKAGGYEADMVTTLRPAGGGLAPNTETKSRLKVNALKGDVEMERAQLINSYGKTAESTLYIKGGVLYSDAHGQKAKLSLGKALLASRANGIAGFPKGAVTYESALDVYGGKQVLFEVKGEALADYVNNQLRGLGLKNAERYLGSAFKDGKVTAVIDPNGNLTECTAEVTFKIRIGESKTTVVQKTEISHIKAGKTTIDFPSDLGAYKESDLKNN